MHAHRGPAFGAAVLVVLSVGATGLAAAGGPGPGERALAAREAAWSETRTTPAGALAVAGLDALWDETSPAAVSAFAARAGADPAAHPLARAQARWAELVIARQLGETARAETARRELGLLDRGLVSGPGPALATDEAAEVAAQAATFRALPAAIARDGVLWLGVTLRGDDTEEALVRAWVELPAGDVALRVGSSGPVTIWIDGVKVLSQAATRPFAIDQDAVAVAVGGGAAGGTRWHRVLVRARSAGAWRLAVRWTALDGAPVAVAWSATEPAAGAPGIAARSSRPVITVRGWLEDAAARAAKGRGGSRAVPWSERGASAGPLIARQLAIFHARVAPDGRDAALTGALGVAGLGAPSESIEIMALALELLEAPEERRRVAERLVRREDAPSAVRAAAELAIARPGAGRAALERARALDPDAWPVALRLAELAGDAELPTVARAELDALARTWPEVGAIARAQARLARRAGRLTEAAEVLERLARSRRAEVGLWLERAELAAARGDEPGADRLLAEGIEADPASPALLQARAEARARVGDRVGARAAWVAVQALAPHDRRARAALAPPGAAQQADRGGHRVDPLEAAYARDPAPIVRSAGTVPRAALGATVLLDLEVTRLRGDGGKDTFGQRLILIQDPRGAEAQRTQELAFVPSTERLDVLAARVHREGGGVLEATVLSRRPLSEPWANVHYDLEAERLRFDALAAGDVIELRWALRDERPDPVSGGELGDQHALGETLPRRESVWIVVAPAARTASLTVVAPGAQIVRRVARGEVVVHVTAGAHPGVEPEERAPGWAELVPLAQASTVASFAAIEARYRALLLPQLVPDEAVRRAARDATAGVTTDEQRVRALHELAARGVRYVALELGVHGFQPYPAPVVLARRFGDCKDKATLLVSLLAEVGVRAHVVLVRTRGQGRLRAPLPSLAAFDHAIVWVPALDAWIDPTAGHAGVRELPNDDQGALALVIGGDGQLIETPTPAAARGRLRRVLAVVLAADGDASVTEDLTIAGAAAAPWRADLGAPEARRARLEARWAAWFPGARVELVDAPGVDRTAQPVLVRVEGQAPVATRLGESLVLPALGRASDLARRTARSSRRVQPLILDPGTEEETLVVTPPPGWKVRRKPEPAVLASPFGTFTLRVEEVDGTVVVRSSFVLDAAEVPPARYGAFRAWLVSVDAARDGIIEVSP